MDPLSGAEGGSGRGKRFNSEERDKPISGREYIPLTRSKQDGRRQRCTGERRLAMLTTTKAAVKGGGRREP